MIFTPLYSTQIDGDAQIVYCKLYILPVWTANSSFTAKLYILSICATNYILQAVFFAAHHCFVHACIAVHLYVVHAFTSLMCSIDRCLCLFDLSFRNLQDKHKLSKKKTPVASQYMGPIALFLLGVLLARQQLVKLQQLLKNRDLFNISVLYLISRSFFIACHIMSLFIYFAPFRSVSLCVSIYLSSFFMFRYFHSRVVQFFNILNIFIFFSFVFLLFCNCHDFICLLFFNSIIYLQETERKTRFSVTNLC